MGFKNILVVEDEKNISDVINAYLIKEGFNVLLAFRFSIPCILKSSSIRYSINNTYYY